MRCPNCGADRPYVLATRRTKDTTRRVRKCRLENCEWVWETIEVILTERVRQQIKQREQLSLPLLQ